ncbi:MAG: KAP family NTPase [Lachnospiraceae bacterium]|nr:KAP family NTPase [Lachnospiraceae bacterium]
MSGFSDIPVSDDQLGCDSYYSSLSNFVVSCPTPMTVAVQGGWGSGKSTAMKVVQKNIEEKACCIEFNTWRFAKTAGNSLILPLLLELSAKLDEFGRDKNYYKKFADNKVRNLVEGALGAVALTGYALIEKYASLANSLDKVTDRLGEAAGKKVLNPVSESVQTRDLIHSQLEERINCICENEKEKKRIVFFIDDLDRLIPEDAVNLLEDIKNMMDFENCVFVLALDNSIVRKGLSKKYGEIGEEDAERFFDKLIQLPFYLPTGSYDIEKYLRSLNRDAVIGSEEDILSLKENLRLFGESNPRSIKRMLNTLLLYKGMDPDLDVSRYFPVILLQFRYKKYYDRIIAYTKSYLSDPMRILEQDYWDGLAGCGKEAEYTDLIGGLRAKRGPFQGNAETFIDVLRVTTVTGESDLFRLQEETRELKELLQAFLQKENERYTGEEGGVDERGRFRFGSTQIEAVTPNSEKDHVNINFRNINREEINIFGAEEEARGLTPECGVSYRDCLEALSGMKVYEDYQTQREDPNETCILSAGPNSICLYRVSAEQYRGLFLAGRMIRNIRKEKPLFSEE